MKTTSIKLQELRQEAKVTTISQAIKACYAQCINGGDAKAKAETEALKAAAAAESAVNSALESIK